jgi:hypothetical protein
VFDPFGGSGSTLIACEKMWRQARPLELDPRYVDTIILRWQKFSGGTATLDGDGQSLEDIARAREAARSLPSLSLLRDDHVQDGEVVARGSRQHEAVPDCPAVR